MKVAELRDLAKKSSKENITNALAAAYKALPKAKKEELDDEICAALKGEKAASKPKEKKMQAVNFAVLRDDVTGFIENAEEGLYYYANRTVTKAKRSKWRFEAGNYLKQLMSYQINDPDYEEAVDLLVRLYQTLARATTVKTFHTEDVFITLGMSQEDLFREVAGRVFAEGINADNVNRMARVSVEWGVGMTGLVGEQVAVLASFMKTDAQKKMLVEESKKIIAEWEKRIPALNSFDYEYYYMQDGKNELDIALLYLEASMGSIDEAIPYYFAHQTHWKDDEISLYCAVRALMSYGTDEDIIKVYDYAVHDLKVEPREELQKIYENVKNKVTQ